jgi:hypothetical protein
MTGREAASLRRHLHSTSLVPLALAEADDIALSGWGTGMRPVGLTGLVLTCRVAAGSAVIDIRLEPDRAPIGLIAPQLLDTAGSLMPDADRAAGVSGERAVIVEIDGRRHAAHAAIDGSLAAIIIKDPPHAGQVLMATVGLDPEHIRLTSAFDLDGAVSRALGEPPDRSAR